MNKLSDYYSQIKYCNRCRLYETCTNLVFGEGNEDADLMFIGEAPGKNEDIQGRPFVGAAGKLLNKLLAEIGLKREDVFIGNIIKCRPPKNRDPYPDEIEACKPYLMKQIKIIKPKIIATLGAHATKTMLNKDVSISRVHGKPMRIDNYTVIPIYHPAAALYRGSVLEDLKEDFQNLKKVTAEDSHSACPPSPKSNSNGRREQSDEGTIERVSINSKEDEKEQPEQGSLF